MDYLRSVSGADLNKLWHELVGAGIQLSVLTWTPLGPPNLLIRTVATPDPGQESIMDSILEAHDGRPRAPRRLYDIYVAIGALAAGQRAAAWSDLSSGSPPKLALDAGPNAAAIFTLHLLADGVAGLTAAEKNEARRRAVAFYVQDNPGYLVGPAFDRTINLPGDELVT